MADQNEHSEVNDEKEISATGKAPMDPVRKWTFIVLGLCALLLIWYLVSDRVTPYSSQAKVHAVIVPIASEVSGTITEVLVRNNQRVNADEVLFQIDTNRYELAVESARAELETARQTMGASRSTVDAARASLDSARASSVRAEQDAIRMRNIREEDPGAISDRSMEAAEAAMVAARSDVAASEANLEKAVQDLGAEGEDNSRLQQAQAALDHAQLDLDRSTVRAPDDGLVTGVRLDTGNYAAAGTPQMTFIAVANIWVQADFTENNLGNIDPGDEVGIVFDVLPGRVIKGAVRETGFGVAIDTAELGTLPTIENDRNWLRESQRFPVLIDVELTTAEGGDRIKVGSQASVVVYTGGNSLVNALASVYIRLVSILTYAY